MNRWSSVAVYKLLVDHPRQYKWISQYIIHYTWIDDSPLQYTRIDEHPLQLLPTYFFFYSSVGISNMQAKECKILPMYCENSMWPGLYIPILPVARAIYTNTPCGQGYIYQYGNRCKISSFIFERFVTNRWKKIFKLKTNFLLITKDWDRVVIV